MNLDPPHWGHSLSTRISCSWGPQEYDHFGYKFLRVSSPVPMNLEPPSVGPFIAHENLPLLGSTRIRPLWVQNPVGVLCTVLFICQLRVQNPLSILCTVFIIRAAFSSRASCVLADSFNQNHLTTMLPPQLHQNMCSDLTTACAMGWPNHN